MATMTGGADMQSNGWSELASLIDTLLDAPVERRRALIDDLSKGDAARRAELEHLLAECENATILNRPAADLFSAMFNEDVTQFPQGLVDRYRVNEELGHGGMATVFHARDLKHGRDVAVKVVHPHLASALGADRFLHEIEIVSQLHHPHIVPLYDSGNVDGFLYYVMPYEPGLSLRQCLIRQGPLAPREVVMILRDVCDALSYAHEHGIIHRDIKPDNVLMSGRHAMVTDFGVAKAATGAAVGGASARRLPVGTPSYMAPEQIEGNRDIDHRADIYAVGVLGYELLAGRPPFTGYTRDEILSRQLTETPPPLSNFRPDVPDELRRVVMRSLEKQPADRWQTAEELLQHLEALAIGSTVARPRAASRGRRLAIGSALAAVALLAAGATVMSRRTAAGPKPAPPLPNLIRWAKRFSAARVERLTDFPGSEVDAAISPNGEFVAFLADRHNVFDAFVTQLGSEQLLNLTGGHYPQLFDENARSVGFSSDGAHLWIRDGDAAASHGLSLLAMPGGRARPFLSDAVMAVWSPDGSRIAYQKAEPGDPIYVSDGEGRNSRRVFLSAPGIHNHYLSWSPDGEFLYFAHGIPPDQMDVWRVQSNSGRVERITSRSSFVAYPIALDARTLAYAATAEDGSGPWLYLLDLGTRALRRVSGGPDRYLSIAASEEMASGGRRLVSTISNPSPALWTVAIDSGAKDSTTLVAPVRVTTGQASAPRFDARGSVVYVGSSGGVNGIWRRSGKSSTEIWTAPRNAVISAAAVSPSSRKICFAVRDQRRSTLHCTMADGGADEIVAGPLDVRGTPSMSPDGKWLAVAVADAGDASHVYKIPVAGGQPIKLVDSVSSNPVWSPNGRFIVYCGPSGERTAPVRAVTPAGKPYRMAAFSAGCAGDGYRFLPDAKSLVVKAGEIQHQDFWIVDVASGARRRLTRLPPGQSIKQFDVARDGKRIVFDAATENSDIVLIDLPRR